ncbi:MAG: hypothetical protein AB2693_26260, partial [Candidatus Thiodiazotropha sp.]
LIFANQFVLCGATWEKGCLIASANGEDPDLTAQMRSQISLPRSREEPITIIKNPQTLATLLVLKGWRKSSQKTPFLAPQASISLSVRLPDDVLTPRKQLGAYFIVY